MSYNKKETPEQAEIGLIAQEVEAVVPELVQTDDDGMKSVSYARTIALLIESVKELEAEIKILKEK